MSKLSSVFIALPTKHQLNVELLPPLIHWIREGAAFYFDCSTLIDNARNSCVRAFLKSGMEYMLFVDSDMLPPKDSLERLLKHNRAIISGIHHAVYKYDDRQNPIIGTSSFTKMEKKENGQTERTLVQLNTGLHKVIGASTAFLLIHKSIFKDWKAPWFRFEWNADYTDYIGEDYWFCMEAARRGFEIYTDSDVFIKHAKQVII